MKNKKITLSAPHFIPIDVKFYTRDECSAGGCHCITIEPGYTAGERWINRCIKCGKTLD